MINVNCLNNIAACGLKLFSDEYNTESSFEDAQAVLVRSAKMHDMELSDNLLAIARAGAGVNNIPLDKCAEEGIVVFNTPGANANAVKEQVIAAMLLASRDLIGGNKWVADNAEDPDIAKATEKAKKAFAGQEIKGKKLGVIGLGAVGAEVANAAVELGMDVYGYDPFVSVSAAWKISSPVHYITDLKDIFRTCDYITIHVPYLPTTKDTINAQTLALCKDGVKILNYARGELVNTAALLEAMETGKVSGYMTDFPTEAILGKPGIVCTPHLGASTPEAEDNCAAMAAQEISDYLKNGNITHSVNMPEVHQPRAGGKRICIIHKNEPGMISQITALTTEAGLNIENMVNKSKKNMAYTMLDATGAVDGKLAEKLAAIPAVIRVRIL